MNRKEDIIYDSLIGMIPEEKISIAQIGYADELIRTSTLDETQKEAAENELSRMDLTGAELSAIINTLKESQPKKH